MLITLGEFKLHLGRTDDEDDDILENLLEEVSVFVEDYCGKAFSDDDVTEIHDGDGKAILIAKRPPINTVASIKISGTQTWGSASDIKDDVLNDPEKGLFYYSARWPKGFQNIQLVYNGGPATPPLSIKLATRLIAASIYNKKALEGRTGVAGQGFSYSFVLTDLPFEARKILDMHKEVSIG